ncbi:MAG TPA: translation initiation factor IF-6 [archaeon]|nr:translation initiation factor IF-6 [archaeon]
MDINFFRTSFNADPNIGLYGFATEKYCLLGFEPAEKIKSEIEKNLGAKIFLSSVAGTQLSGLFSAGNSNGIVVSKITEKHELAELKKHFENILVLDSDFTCVGNLILVNDKAAIISQHLKKFSKEISDCLGVPVETGTVAGLEIVGSAACATNLGCLCHPSASEEEMKKIQEFLKVKVDVGTTNYGSPFVKAGLLVNSNGFIASEISSGPELGRIAEVFGKD